MNRVGDDLLLEALQAQEEQIQTAADAVDTKAGLVLAACAFLAVQPAVLLIVPEVPKLLFFAQLVGFVVLSVSVGLSLRIMKIKGYETPGFDESWRDSVISDARPGATEEDVRKTILWGLIEQAKRRVALNRAINESKLRVLENAQKLTTISFVLNMLILAAIFIARFF